MNRNESQSAWQNDRVRLEMLGAVFPSVVMYTPDEYKRDYRLAMDAQPTLATNPNSAIPAMLTTMIDPSVFKILFSPNKAAKIFGENKKGNWLDQTAMFPVVEHTGEVSSYGDWNTNGHAGANTNFPQRQAYLYQTIKEYGELELERAGLARVNWVSEIDIAAATVLDKFQNISYFFGIGGLQNYGLLNDPNLGAALTPAPKAYGNALWITNGVVTATANEIFTDIQSLFIQLITQTNGLVDQESSVVLALSPASKSALTATNSFNVNVYKLLKDNFPNIRIEDAVQYAAQSATNPTGVAGGNFMQMFVENIEGQDTGYCAFNEKMRAGKVINDLSSWKQKVTGGTWGCIIRMPISFVSMLGI